MEFWERGVTFNFSFKNYVTIPFYLEFPLSISDLNYSWIPLQSLQSPLKSHSRLFARVSALSLPPLPVDSTKTLLWTQLFSLTLSLGMRPQCLKHTFYLRFSAEMSDLHSILFFTLHSSILILLHLVPHCFQRILLPLFLHSHGNPTSC